MAAVYFQQDEIGFKHTGVTVTIPNNDVARLMYYLKCVCTAVECDEDTEIQRFTRYQNWGYLSIDEQKMLLALCYTFSPDIFDGKVFFESDALCGDSLNDFLEISQVRHQFLAAESIVIAGRTREVNKIMVYKRQWLNQYYLIPMQGLVRKLNSSTRPAITHPAPSRPTYTPNQRLISSPRTVHRSTNENSCCHCSTAFVIGSICGSLVIVGIIVGIVYFLMNR